MIQPKLIEEKYNIKKIRKLMSNLYSVILWYDDRRELPEDWIDYAYKPLMLLLKELKIDTENAKLLKKKNDRKIKFVCKNV